MKRHFLFKVLLTLVVGTFLSIDAFAQQITVKGLVKDNTGEPIIGANVVVKGTTNGTITDFDGNFEFTANQGEIIVISFIGYKSQELPATANFMNVVLQDDSEMLSEVVVIGYGTVRKTDLSGSVVSVQAEDLNRGAITSPQEMLQGKVSGLFIQPGSGAPGAGSTLRIRGGASLKASNDPLIVVDGVPLANDAAPGMSNALATINPNDIESFSVLKDASATAIYGSRASNGVIIITTKKGSQDKLKVTYSSTYSLQDPYNRMKMMNSQQLVSSMLGVYAEGTNAGDNLRQMFQEYGTISMDANGNMVYTGVDTDWQDQIFRTAFKTDQNISLSGNIAKVPFRASIGYSNEDGTLKKSNFERYTGSISLTPKLFDDHLSITLNAKGTWVNNKYGNDGAVGAAIFFDPTKPVYNEGNPVQSGKFNGYYNWIDSSGNPNTLATENPLSQMNNYKNDGKTKRFTGNAQFDYKMHFLPELRANLNIGLDVLESTGNSSNAIGSFSAAKDTDFPNYSGNTDWTNYRKNELLEFYLAYANEFKSINSRIDAMAGYSWQHFYGSKLSIYRSNGTATDMGLTSVPGYDLQNDDYFVKQGSYRLPWENYLVSFFGRINYTFMDRYLLTATLRRDGSSRFSEDNRWGLFPSAAFAWTIKNEKFLEDVDVLSNLKLRLGYGVTGQQEFEDNYAYIPSYLFGTNPHSTYFGQNLLKPGGFNPDLKWEATTTYNIAVDYGFFNNLINGSVEVYMKKTKDLLNLMPTAAGTNYISEITGNVGEMENKGVEVAINTVPIEAKDWRWELNYNITWNTSEITKLTAVYNPEYLGIPTGSVGFGTGTNVQKHMVGYAPSTFYLYEQVYDINGMPIQNAAVDQNQDGQITDADRYLTDKSPAPKVFMGLSSMISYKNFDFGFNLRANIGNYMFNELAAGNSSIANFWNQGSVSNLPVFALNSGFTKTSMLQQQLSDYFLEDASFLKCDNITVGYNFSNFTKAKLSGRLSLSVQNVFTITNYSGLDPETTGNGIDGSVWPRPRTYTLGLNINF